MDRKRVLICDDQERFIEQFKKNHSDYFDITPVRDVRQVIDELHGMKTLPDIVLLDLYHPTNEDEGFEVRRQKAEAELKKLNMQIDNTKRAVDATWQPLGIEILADIRREYTPQSLPVVIYSQRGLFLLDDAQVRSVEEHNGHWLLKNQFCPRTEKMRMDRIMNYAGQARPLLSAYRRALVVSWATFLAVALGISPPERQSQSPLEV
jgi:CheY-like chemotaxis protein